MPFYTFEVVKAVTVAARDLDSALDLIEHNHMTGDNPGMARLVAQSDQKITTKSNAWTLRTGD